MDEGVFTSATEATSWQQSPSDTSNTGVGKRGAAWIFAASASQAQSLVGTDTGVFPLVSPLTSSELRKRWRPWFILSIVLLACVLLLLLTGIITDIPGVRGQIAENSPVALYWLSNLLLNYAYVFTGFLWYILVIVGVLALALLGWRWWSLRHTWTSTLPAIPFHALAYQHNQFLAACSEGLFRSSDHGQHWTKIDHSPVVQVFAPDALPALFAGTQDGRVLRSEDAGNTWQDFSPGLQLSNVQAFASATGGIFAAGQPDSTDPDAQWNHIQLQRGDVDLDKLYPRVLPGSWIMLRQGNRVALFKGLTVETRPCKDFKKGKDITSIYVDGSANGEKLAAFARNATAVFAQNERLALFDDRPLQGDTLPFDRFVPKLAPDQYLSVSGKRARLRVSGHVGTPLELTSTDGARKASFTAAETLIVMAPSTPAPAGGYTWLLQDRNGFVGSFTAPLEATSYEAADEQDETVSELVTIGAIQQQETTTVLLASDHALANVYDRSSVTCCANIVHATHGQTVANEVLGSVDIGHDRRSFSLKQKPLTYVSSLAAETDQPDMLTILVNGIPWQRVPSFLNAESGQRAYMVQHDSSGNTSIIFGDGERGAHLPTGQEHITATYRVGSGQAGNIPANSLTVLRTRPPGVQQVTNPVPATGGVDAETMDDARLNAPLHVQGMERIVTPNDYEYFTRVFAGVSKVQVKMLWYERRKVIHITVAGEQGQAVARDALLSAINAATAPLSPPAFVDECETLYFQVDAALVIEAAYVPLADTVLAQARDALTGAFSFSRRELGQSLALAEIVTVLQAVPGVVAVQMHHLYLTGATPALNTFLEARPARVETATFHPAQLLLIDERSPQAIVLTQA